jgi:hypothetical protein
MFIKNFKRPLFIIAALCAFCSQGYSQDKAIPKDLYIAATIPDSLKQDANSVVRYSMEDDNFKGPGKAYERIHTIVTVLNEKGNDEASKVLGYNKKFNAINSFEMRVYSADGTLIKKYHKSDMYDRSAVSNETIVTDDRTLSIEHAIASYPTTVEFIYDEDLKSLIDLGTWAYQDYEQSVQNAYYHVSIASNAGFRYLNKNTNIKPQKTTADNIDSYSWQVSNLKAYKHEEGSKGWRVLPRICFAASGFEFYGIPGDISTWQNYGKWQQALNADVCSLSPERVEEIKKMTADIKTDKEKVKFLYEYMQQNMRYVSIQLGIGGLKPFAATFVDQKKYGDCKALSNYMYALLKAVNIPSCYAIINAGENQEPANPSFPFDPFNHVILCVPFKSDTTWLECTSMTQPFGKLGSFTENRYALLVNEDGGKLVCTPKSKDADNQFNSEVHLTLDADGGAKAQVKILSTGTYRDDYIGLTYLKTDEQKEYVIRMLGMKQPSVLNLIPATDKEGLKEVNIELEYDKFCDIATADKQFYRPRVFSLWQSTVPVEQKRKSDYYFETPMLKTCTTTIDLPAGFEIETLPTDQSLKFTYGSYEVKYKYDAARNQVISTAKFNLTNQVIPAAKYTELQVYLDAVAKAQNKKLVIHHKA